MIVNTATLRGRIVAADILGFGIRLDSEADIPRAQQIAKDLGLSIRSIKMVEKLGQPNEKDPSE